MASYAQAHVYEVAGNGGGGQGKPLSALLHTLPSPSTHKPSQVLP